MRKLSAGFLSLFLYLVTSAQTAETVVDSASVTLPVLNERQLGLQKRRAMENSTLLSNVEFTNIGPTIMSGRVTDLDVNPKDPAKFYVSYASGGLWYTENNGQSFTPLFDNEDVITIGDFAVDWTNNIIWVGTGEVNSSRSSYAGIGVYKSVNGGKSWEYCGLPESHHIGRIVINPRNPEMVYVAVMGHLYTPNPERGVYKTIDGGKTWKQTLFVDENTGAVDLLIDPNVPDFLYACTWHRERRAWNFVESGNGSGIYKSVDQGETWNLLTKNGSGFPQGEGIGRIGIAVSYQRNNIVYAVVDNQTPKEVNPAERMRLADAEIFNIDTLKALTKEKFAMLDNEQLSKFLEKNKFPKDQTASVLKEKVASEEYLPTVLTDFLNDGGYIFNLPIKGCEIYRSDDGGTTWFRTHDKYLDGAFFTYGYYFSTIKVSPKNDNKIIVSAFNALLSEDGGKTFKNIDGDNVHPDHHAAWMNPANDKHIIVGNDGGVNITYDNGKNWYLANNPAVGQFYSVAVDDAIPYNVYGGLQDNGVWTGPSTYNKSNYWYASGKYPYQVLYGGDGMQVQVDTRNNETVYTGYQFGYYARLNKNSGKEEISIRPSTKFGEAPLRYNWQTPILLSKHNQDILYYGSNRFHRSLNKGENLVTLSDDLSNGKKEGDVAFGTITTISESPLKFGLIYCGTDDGNVWMSKDNGYNWNKINVFIKKEMPPTKAKTPPPAVNMIPDGLWVSRVTAGRYNESTVIVSLNGYRDDNFNPYLFISDDYGLTWTQIGSDLPAEPINVVKEDPKNYNILYVGTDNGLYISLNRGKNFMTFSAGLPRVAVHDIAIQERENEMVVGTHGRSLYKVKLNEVQQLDALITKEIHLFPIDDITYDENLGKQFNVFNDTYVYDHVIPYFVKSPGIITIQIATDDGTIIKEMTDSAEAGINYLKYDLSLENIFEAAYENYLNNQPVDGMRKVADVKVADNGKLYVLPGKFQIKMSTESLNNVVENFKVVKLD